MPDLTATTAFKAPKQKNTYQGNYTWIRQSPIAATRLALKIATDGLLKEAPFNDVSSKERVAVVQCGANIKSALDAMLDEDGKLKGELSNADIETLFNQEIARTINTLKNQEIKNKIHSAFMKACGVVLNILSFIMPGHENRKDYINSFFKPAEQSAAMYENTMTEAMIEINLLLDGRQDYFLAIEKNIVSYEFKS